MNLFDVEHPSTGERFDTLLRRGRIVIERIASSGEVDGKVYDQEQDEWVALLRGSASLDVAGDERALAVGDCVFIAARQQHRVVSCSRDALWLAVHVHPAAPPAACEIVEGTFAEVAAMELQIAELDDKYDQVAIRSRVGRRKHFCLVARVDGEPAGYKLGYEETAERFYSWIGGVVAAHRRRGIAQQLLLAQESWCRDNGYREIAVKSQNRFRSMIALLVRNEYDVFGVQLNGAIVFRKQL